MSNENEARKYIVARIAGGLIGDEFQSKGGATYRSVSIPNADKEDNTPWESFVLPTEKFIEVKDTNSYIVFLPTEGNLTLRRSVKSENGEYVAGEYEERRLNAKDVKDLINKNTERDDKEYVRLVIANSNISEPRQTKNGAEIVNVRVVTGCDENGKNIWESFVTTPGRIHSNDSKNTSNIFLPADGETTLSIGEKDEKGEWVNTSRKLNNSDLAYKVAESWKAYFTKEGEQPEIKKTSDAGKAEDKQAPENDFIKVM